MEKGIYAATSAGIAQERAMEIISNNLANMNTNGFKADRLMFQSYLQKSAREAAANPPTTDEIRKGYASIGNNDTVYKIGSQSYTDYSQGSLLTTGNPLDVALNGKGFLVVQTPDGERYTRGGSLKLDLSGTLVTSEGYAVLDSNGQNINVGTVMKPISIAEDGTVSVADTGSTSVADVVPMGKMKMVDFSDRTQLEKIGVGLYKAADGASPEQSDAQIKQGFLEGSNINPVGEMTRMITGQRAYDSMQKAIQSQDEINQRLISDVAR